MSRLWDVTYSDGSVATINGGDEFTPQAGIVAAYPSPVASSPPAVLASATAKLVDLGLTPDEAAAVIGTPTDAP